MIKILLIEAEGNVSHVSEIIGICRNAVKADRAYDPRNPDAAKKAGRPEKLTPAAKMYIYTITFSCPTISAIDIARTLIQPPFLVGVCETTINKYRHVCKFKYGPRIRETKQTPASLVKRMQFAMYHLHNQTDWTRTVFSDESYFKLGASNRRIWRMSGDYRPEVCTSEVSHPPMVLVWGAIGFGYKSKLCFIEGTVTSKVYTGTILKESGFTNHANEHFGVGMWTFQQDNARPHVAQASMKFFAKERITLLRDWPPYSPDLNVIEIIWAIMGSRVEKVGPQTIKELIQVLQDVWDNLTIETINALINSVKSRLQQLLANEGRQVHSYHQ